MLNWPSTVLRTYLSSHSLRRKDSPASATHFSKARLLLAGQFCVPPGGSTCSSRLLFSSPIYRSTLQLYLEVEDNASSSSENVRGRLRTSRSKVTQSSLGCQDTSGIANNPRICSATFSSINGNRDSFLYCGRGHKSYGDRFVGDWTIYGQSWGAPAILRSSFLRTWIGTPRNSPLAWRTKNRLFSSVAITGRVKISLRHEALRTHARAEPLRSRAKEMQYQRRLRIKTTSLKMDTRTGQLEKFSRTWAKNFAKLNDIRARHAQSLAFRQQYGQLSSLSCQSGTPRSASQDGAFVRWMSMRKKKAKSKKRHFALLNALRLNPPEALSIVEDNLTKNGRYFSAYVVKDCLDHLACIYLLDVDSPSESSVEALHHTACQYFATYGATASSTSLSQRTLWLLSEYCDADKLLSLFECLRRYKGHISDFTTFHLMTRFVECGDIEVALSLLRKLSKEMMFSELLQRFCVMLLRANIETDDLYRMRYNILRYMLEIGVRPNRILADVIVLNAMEAGDLNTAWQAHKIAQENGLSPDPGTYTALLKGIQHGDDIGRIQYIRNCAEKDGCLASDSRLRFELLYAMYVAEERGLRPKPFSALLPSYRQFFDVQSLQDLNILSNCENSTKTDIEPFQPTVQPLGLIILAWLREHHMTDQVQSVYERYIHHVKAGHSTISQLAEKDYVANAFIIAFGQRAQTLPLCTQVVQHMLKPEVANSSSGQGSFDGTDTKSNSLALPEDRKRKYKVSPPTLQTWNVLIFAFIRNRQAAAAEKILEIMESRGQEPSEVTWNTLLTSYGSMQDLEGVVISLKRMEKTNLAANKWTMKALSRVKDQKALLKAFENSTKEEITLEQYNKW